MSAEKDVPLGDGSRRYYEEQFGERIRRVNKGGRGGSGGGGSNWNGRAGIGIAVGVIVIILRVVVAISRTTSSDYRPPIRQPVSFADLREKMDMENPRREPPPFLVPEENNEEDLDPFFMDKDVPLPQGLCYRIQQESRQPEATPGKRIFALLTADQRTLIAQAASGRKLTPEQQETLTETWNSLLRSPNLMDEESFAPVRASVTLRFAEQIVRDQVKFSDPLFHRLLLEACYPQQIVPLSKRKQLQEVIHEPFLAHALADLRAARQKYEPANP